LAASSKHRSNFPCLQQRRLRAGPVALWPACSVARLDPNKGRLRFQLAVDDRQGLFLAARMSVFWLKIPPGNSSRVPRHAAEDSLCSAAIAVMLALAFTTSTRQDATLDYSLHANRLVVSVRCAAASCWLALTAPIPLRNSLFASFATDHGRAIGPEPVLDRRFEQSPAALQWARMIDAHSIVVAAWQPNQQW